MGAIHVLMAATLISTYLISAHFARKYTNGKKHHSDAYNSGVQAGVNTSQAMKKWLAGRELPTFEELTEGCYAIAREDTTLSGCVPVKKHTSTHDEGTHTHACPLTVADSLALACSLSFGTAASGFSAPTIATTASRTRTSLIIMASPSTCARTCTGRTRSTTVAQVVCIHDKKFASVGCERQFHVWSSWHIYSYMHIS